MVTGGRGLVDPLEPSGGHADMEKLIDRYGAGTSRDFFQRGKADGKLTFDRLTDVFHSGTIHEEDQPAHLHVADPNICETTLPRRNTGTPARSSVRPRSTRWCRRTTAVRIAEAPDQLLELRPLQDLRHHGSVPDHHLGDARRAEADRSTTACRTAARSVRYASRRGAASVAVRPGPSLCCAPQLNRKRAGSGDLHGLQSR